MTVRREDIQDLYELSPLQRGLLFHAIEAPHSGTYVVQLSCALEGALDVPTLEAAWQATLDRHSILRTSFHWEDLRKPLQVVHKEAQIEIEQDDWRSLPAAEQQARLLRFLDDDREAGFQLDRAPLMRLRVFQMADDCRHFMWTHHHLLLDGWSVQLVLSEVLDRYRALRLGQAPQLRPARPFGDFIAWLQEQDGERAEAFWRTLLAGFNNPTALRIDRAADGAPTSVRDYRSQEVPLPSPAWQGLRTQGRQLGLTLNTLVQGAWAMLLSRYSGEEDVVFGGVVSGRPPALSGSDTMVGPFINTLPVRVQVDPEARLSAWLQALQARLADIRQFEYSALEDVQAWSDVPRGRPLFESLLVVENYPVQTKGDAGSALQISNTRISERTNYPLTLVAAPGAQLQLRLLYDTARFEPDAIDRLGGHLRTLLEQMAEAFDRPVGELEMLTTAEQHQILHDWNATKREFGPVQPVQQLVQGQAEHWPDRTAVVGASETISYGELNERANQLAHALQRLDIGPENLVGILVDRSPDMVVAMLAVLKAGAAYLPLDPSYPSERLAFMLADAQVPVLLTQRALRSRVPEFSGGVFALDADWPGMASESRENPACIVQPNSLAYVIYTSGSTGLPKGSEITHSGLFNLVRWHQEAYAITAADRASQVASQAFDATVWEVWPYLAAGAEVHIADDETRMSPEAMRDWLLEHDITIGFLPTAMAEAVMRLDWPAHTPLRTLLTGADALRDYPSPRLPFRLVNNYGPTECSVVSTAGEVPAFETAPGQPPSIGRPIANVQAQVLDQRLRLVPMGVPGELYIAGANVGRGYLGRPELTAEKFSWTRFGESPAYQTGDLVRWRPDGSLDFLGRADQQVKVRGYRIEPGEIEAALKRDAAVADALVMAQDGDAGEKRLVAYVVPATGHRPSVDALRHAAGNRLPAHMVPATFVLIDTLPLTPNGKLDRGALPAPHEALRSQDSFAEPRTPAEAALASVWADVLRVPLVGIHDNFFSLGGDSILAIQVASRAKRAGFQVTSRQLFLHQTVAELAAVAEVAPAYDRMEDADTSGLPLTAIQRWFFEQRMPDQHHFNQAVVLEIDQPVDIGALERALSALVDQHDALRLRFSRAGEELSQMVAPSGGWAALAFHDLTGLDAAAEDEELEQAAGALQAGLDLAHGPLLRAGLFQLRASRPALLLLAAHHLAVDGVSWRILLEQLETAYGQARLGRSIELESPTASFRRWAQAIQTYAQSPEIENQAEFWRSMPDTEPLPVDEPDGGNLYRDATTIAASLTPAETQALLQDVPRAYRTEINDVLLTALTQAIAGWSPRDAVLLDVEGHGREEIDGLDLSRTVGWFTSMFPVLLRINPGMGPGQALTSVKEQLRGLPRKGIGYGLLRYLRRDPVLSTQRPAPISFNYLGQFDQTLPGASALRLADRTLGPLYSPRIPRLRPIDVVAWIAGGQLQASWTYSSCMYRGSTMQGLADRFGEAVRVLIRHCQSPDAGAYSASDFPKARVSQRSLDALAGQIH